MCYSWDDHTAAEVKQLIRELKGIGSCQSDLIFETYSNECLRSILSSQSSGITEQQLRQAMVELFLRG